MLQTVVMTSHISVQGDFVKNLADGRTMVRVGEMHYVGKPIVHCIERAIKSVTKT